MKLKGDLRRQLRAGRCQHGVQHGVLEPFHIHLDQRHRRQVGVGGKGRPVQRHHVGAGLAAGVQQAGRAVAALTPHSGHPRHAHRVGQRHGQGKITMASGFVYEGEWTEGEIEGELVGPDVGSVVGSAEGAAVGETVGSTDGEAVGSAVGRREGIAEGAAEGIADEHILDDISHSDPLSGCISISRSKKYSAGSNAMI